ncbi:MAG: hypothetical protein ACRYFS_12470 [Janthinobacterium lividum]
MSNETTDFLKMPPPPTEEEWQKLQPLIEKSKADGNPWAAAAGIFRNDPFFDEWVEIMQENRRKADEDPNY